MTTPIKSLIQTMRELREVAHNGPWEVDASNCVLTAYEINTHTRSGYQKLKHQIAECDIGVPGRQNAEFIAAAPANQERLEKALEIAAEALDLLLRTGTGGHNLCDSGDCHIARAHSKGSRMMFEIEATLRGEK